MSDSSESSKSNIDPQEREDSKEEKRSLQKPIEPAEEFSHISNGHSKQSESNSDVLERVIKSFGRYVPTTREHLPYTTKFGNEGYLKKLDLSEIKFGRK